MGTLGNVPHRPFPGVEPGTIASEMAQVLAQIDAAIEEAYAAPRPYDPLDPQALRDAILDLAAALDARRDAPEGHPVACPFCGETALDIETQPEAYVRCVCGGRGPLACTAEDAIALWNTRSGHA